MKKIGFTAFIVALAIGSIFSANCNSVGFGSLTGVRGSGNSKSETRNASGFKGIKAGGAVNVEVTAQKDYSVAVEADDNLLPYIKTEVSGDVLKIYTEDRISSKSDINIKISMPEINSADISGASSAIISNVKTDSVKLETSGASKIKVNGEAKSLESKASGASGIDAENLKAENANIEASGASNTTVSATNEVKADASGASTIYYAGNPKNVKQNSSGASTIKKK